MQPDNNLHSPRWQSSPRLLPALIIIGVGVLFLLGNLHVLDAADWFRYWPAILIAVGLLALLLMLAVGFGALVILPVTVGICFVGWLVAGSTGAIVGLVLSGILGAVVLAKAGSSP